MQLIIEHAPMCGTDWTKLALVHIESYEHRDLGKAEKTTNAIRRRYNLLVRRSKKKPTGDPNIPPELAYARQASKAIIERAGIDGLPSDDSDSVVDASGRDECLVIAAAINMFPCRNGWIRERFTRNTTISEAPSFET